MPAVSRLSVGCFVVLLAAGQAGCGSTSSGSPQGSGGSSESSGSGGHASSGGANGTGGSVGSGGVSSASGGSSGSGGAIGSGGKTSSGGVTGTGGTSGGSGGAPGTGSGGSLAGTGGKIGGGGTAAGGARASGGVAGTAGAPGTGGTTGGNGGSSGGVSSGENNFASCMAKAGDTKKNMKLPNPFLMHDGTMITTKAQWECRRAEIKADLEKYEIGPKQDPSTVTSVKATLSGKSLSVVITTSAGSMTLTSTVSGSGSCILIGLDSPQSLVTGCTSVPFTSSQVVKSEQDSMQYQSDPFYKVYPNLWQKIGNYSAWSWGVSRLIDGLEQVKDQLNVDTTKIAVHGCSYAGKMALFSGALDERIALAVVEESGGGGINSWRTSQDFEKSGAPSIEKIDNTNYGWFLPSMQKLDPYSLPHDHHELIAMIAPRAVIILGNDNYDWLGDESGYKSTMAALQVFTALGVADHLGYDFTSPSGQSHCSPPASHQASVKTFAQRFLQGGTGTTNVAIKPSKSGFDLNWMGSVDWTTPTLQ